MYVTTMWCEWDIGINNKIFSDQKLAKSLAEQALIECGIEETIDELEEDGLIGFETVEVVTE